MALRWNFYPTLNEEELQVFSKYLAEFLGNETSFYSLPHLNDFLWVAGRSRFERLLLAGILLTPERYFTIHNSFGTSLRVFSSRHQLLIESLKKEGMDGLVKFWEKRIKRKEFFFDVRYGYEYLLAPVANEFASFSSIVYRLGKRAFDEIDFPPQNIPIPLDDLVKRVIKEMEKTGISQPPHFQPASDYRPSQLSFSIQKFIVYWRRALFLSYGIFPEGGGKLRIDLDQAERERLPLFQWEWQPLIRSREIQPYDSAKKFLKKFELEKLERIWKGGDKDGD